MFTGDGAVTNEVVNGSKKLLNLQLWHYSGFALALSLLMTACHIFLSSRAMIATPGRKMVRKKPDRVLVNAVRCPR